MDRLGRTHGLVGIDTNVLVRAVLGDDPEQSSLAQRALAELTVDEPGFITMVTMAEFYWVLTRRPDLNKDAVLMIIDRLIQAEELEFEDGEGVVRALHLALDGADFPDALIQASMEMFGTNSVLTFDRRAASRLGWRLLEA